MPLKALRMFQVLKCIEIQLVGNVKLFRLEDMGTSRNGRHGSQFGNQSKL